MEMFPSYKKSTNLDKAMLLYCLFPEEMPELIGYINTTCAQIRQREDLNRQIWNNQVFTFTTWLHIVKSVEASIATFQLGATSDAQLFATLMYKGNQSYFVDRCILQYLKYKQHSKKFQQAIEFLFKH